MTTDSGNARDTRAPRTLVIVPMYNCAPQITRVLAQIDSECTRYVSRVLVIDNRSTDDGLRVASDVVARMTTPEVLLVRNRANYGLGGSHKVGFQHAIAHGFERVIILHGDDQAAISDLLPTLLRAPALDAWLGARFMHGSTLQGYSRLRTTGNRAFNLLVSAITGRHIFDLGSGLNAYDVGILRDGFYRRFPDDLTFNYCMTLAHVALGHDIAFVPIRWREEDQRSNVQLTRQGLAFLRMLSRYLLGRTSFLHREWRQQPHESYETEFVAANYVATV